MFIFAESFINTRLEDWGRFYSCRGGPAIGVAADGKVSAGDPR